MQKMLASTMKSKTLVGVAEEEGPEDSLEALLHNGTADMIMPGAKTRKRQSAGVGTYIFYSFR